MTDIKRIAIPAAPPAPHTEPPALDARLAAAASFVRGGVVADVGTDHAYLPIALLRSGRCSFAVATDIHLGPAQTAAAHLSSYGLGESEAAVLLTDGLHGCHPYAPNDICVLGMGGEMIVHIIDQAPWVRSPDVRLILQPMTRAEVLRTYLDANGFCVTDELLVCTDRIYQVLCVTYDGAVRTHTPLELLLGEHNVRRADRLSVDYARRQLAILTQSRQGKLLSAAPDTALEDTLIPLLHDFLDRHATQLHATEDSV